MAKNQALTLLGGLTPSEFLAEYWQKKPLLIKKAIPDFTGLLNPDDLAGLACEDDVQSRIAQIKNGKWTVKSGPFDEAVFSKLPNKNWTLLVQSVNHYVPEAEDLLAQFDFIPHARLDDLMVSYAPDGGGIGAHMDSYDVFLLQGRGRRNWKISNTDSKKPADLSLIENAPLKILKNFEPEQEWILETGDMLYLPPQIAHLGTAVGEDCMTYSIGFRAPKEQELMHEFLSYLQDDLTLKNTQNLYADPDLQLQKHPAEIGIAMIDQVSDMLQKMTWDKKTVADFLAKYLTEPKPDVFFEPNKVLSKKQFLTRLQQKTLRLDLKSQLLFSNDVFYLNGEKLLVENALVETLKDFADKRYLDKNNLTESLCEALADALFEHYLAGFIVFD